MHSQMDDTQFTFYRVPILHKKWQIEHRVASHTNAQCNRQVEEVFTDCQEQSHKVDGRRRGHTFNHFGIHYNTLESAVYHQQSELLKSRKFRCLLPFLNEATKPHTPVQESDTTTKALTSKALWQKCQTFTQFGDWQCSTCQVSAKCNEVGFWDHNWKNQWEIIHSQDCIRSCLCEESQYQADRLKTES